MVVYIVCSYSLFFSFSEMLLWCSVALRAISCRQHIILTLL